MTRGVLLAALVVLAAVTGTAMGAWNGQVTTSDDTPNAEDVTYTFYATVGDEFDGHTLHNDSIQINLQSTGLRTGDITTADIELVAIDVRGDFDDDDFNILLTPIVESVAADNTERTLSVRLNASVDDTANSVGIVASETEVMENDQVIVKVSNLTNPAAGEYPINIDLSKKKTGGQVTATLNIEEEPTPTTEPPWAHTHTEEPADTTTSGENGPGFTVVIAALALLTAALIAVRRT